MPNSTKPEIFILIPGRTSRQGTTLNEGKFTADYTDETTTLSMNPDDMSRLGLQKGDRVRLKTAQGLVELPCVAAKAGELPTGVLFLPYGDASSRLMGGDTHGSGMPDSKSFDVALFIVWRGREHASDDLLNAIQGKGRTIVIAEDGSEEQRFLRAFGANANVGGENMCHIILQRDARKLEALEEFLHGTQHRLGIITTYGPVGAESHVKHFMLRHRKLLGLSDADVGILRAMLGD